MSQYRITDGKDIELKDIMLQLKSIKEFPATLHIYDRVFVISNKEEMWALLHGVELGWYLAEEHEENNRKPAVVSRAIDPEGFTGRVHRFEE
jgi:hypothetical protein